MTKVILNYDELIEATINYQLSKHVQIDFVLTNIGFEIEISTLGRSSSGGISSYYGPLLSHEYYFSNNIDSFVLRNNMDKIDSVILLLLFIDLIRIITNKDIKLFECPRHRWLYIESLTKCTQCSNYLQCLSQGINVVI